MLAVKSKIVDRQLEPDDESRFEVEVINGSPVATAKAVKVSARLDGGECKGVEIRPAELDFGTIPPNGRAKKDFSIHTKSAEPRNYQAKFGLKFESTTPTHECDQEEFTVVPD